jgi:hypothetical protein
MSEIPQFRHVQVYRLSPGCAAVRWVMHPHSWPESDLAFAVFRANSPEGPFEHVGNVDDGSFQFADWAAQGINISRNFYYRVRVASKSGKGYRDSWSANPGHDLDPIGEEMIRKKMVFITVKSGVAGAVLLKKSWGARCSRCFNRERMAAEDASCPECYGTGFTGGYLPPILVPTLFNPPKSAIVEAGIKYETWSVYVELANYPFLSPDDIWVDRQSNIRYKVENVGIAAHRGAIVSQVAQLNRCDENDAVYDISIPAPQNSMLERSYDIKPPLTPV